MSASRTPRLLLTGFEPFGGHARNESALIAQALHGQAIGALKVHAAELPCVFGHSLQRLVQWVEELQPSVIVCLGLAASRQELSMERVALNVDDARIPDNHAQQPIDQPVVPGGPVAYWSTLPIKRMAAAVQARGLPASVSHTAGTFVCNHVFYGLMHHLAHRPEASRPRGGFIHVPACGNAWPADAEPAQRWTLEDLVGGIHAALAAAVEGRIDAQITGGLID